jgi:quinolinate synthase
MKQQAPNKRFIPVSSNAVCRFMKTITLEKVLRSLEEEIYEITVPSEIAARARGAIDRMLEIT